MVCVVAGSPGTQWSGVRDQSKATWRGLSSVCSDATGTGRFPGLTGFPGPSGCLLAVLDMASMYFRVSVGDRGTAEDCAPGEHGLSGTGYTSS
ncbi:hypothetical protein GCM10027091_61740 [Streptomyces daliensis]